METVNNTTHGYIQNGYIVLHNAAYSHEDENGHSVYVPRRVAINPNEILAVEDKRPVDKENIASSNVYYKNREHDNVYESFDEIMDLIAEVNKKVKVKPLYD